MNSRPIWPDCPEIRHFLTKLSFSELIAFLSRFNGHLPISLVEEILRRCDCKSSDLWCLLFNHRENIIAKSDQHQLESLLVRYLETVGGVNGILAIVRNYDSCKSTPASVLQSLVEKTLSLVEKEKDLNSIWVWQRSRAWQELTLVFLHCYISRARHPDAEWAASMLAKLAALPDDRQRSRFAWLTREYLGYSAPHRFLLLPLWKQWLEYLHASDDADQMFDCVKNLVCLLEAGDAFQSPPPEVAAFVSSETLERLEWLVLFCESHRGQLMALLVGNHIVSAADEPLQRQWWELVARLPENFRQKRPYASKKTPRGCQFTLHQGLVRNVRMVQRDFLVSAVLRFICPPGDAPPLGLGTFSSILTRWMRLFPDPPEIDPSLPSVWQPIRRLAESHISWLSPQWKNEMWGDGRWSSVLTAASSQTITADSSFVRELLSDFVRWTVALPKQLCWKVIRLSGVYRHPFAVGILRELLEDRNVSLPPEAFISRRKFSLDSFPHTPQDSFSSTVYADHLELLSSAVSRCSRAEFIEMALATHRQISGENELQETLAFYLTSALVHFPARIQYLLMFDLLSLAARRYLTILENNASSPDSVPASFESWVKDRLFPTDGIHPRLKAVCKKVLAGISAGINREDDKW